MQSTVCIAHKIEGLSQFIFADSDLCRCAVNSQRRRQHVLMASQLQQDPYEVTMLRYAVHVSFTGFQEHVLAAGSASSKNSKRR